MAKQNPGLTQDTQTHKMGKLTRSNEHQISANAAWQTQSPIVASMTCPTTLDRLDSTLVVAVVLLDMSWPSRLSRADDQPSSNF